MSFQMQNLNVCIAGFQMEHIHCGHVVFSLETLDLDNFYMYFVGGAPLNGGNCVRQDFKLICLHPLSKVFSCKCWPLSLFSALFVHQKLKKS